MTRESYCEIENAERAGTPLVTVIMSAYNDQIYIRSAIESILTQSFMDFEFIITDDASSDDTLSILMEYMRSDSRIKILRNEKNQGLTVSLNNMIIQSNGQYIARMDADDIAIKNRLFMQVEYMENNPAVDLCFSDTILIDAKGEVLCSSWRPSSVQKILRVLEWRNFIPHPSVMIKSSVIKRYMYNPACRTGQDLELWLRLREDNKKFGYIAKPLIFYRINPMSVRKDKSQTFILDYENAKALIDNRQKKNALQYIKRLKGKQRIIMMIKLLIPFHLLLYKGYLVKMIKRRRLKKDV
ncbi:glycosyltransferase [Eubacteriales bacterium OttesenSCG-928-M02]|nr:glycosyltransferase [Eubacteriales bacterium OttesenSCG-928-M02]